MKDIKDYYLDGAISQSSLKLLIERPLDFVERPVIDSDSLILGSFVDMLLTQEKPEYSVCRKIPNGGVKKVLSYLFANEDLRYKDLVDIEKSIVDACDVLNVYTHYKPMTRVDKVRDYEDYWKAMQSCNGGIILNPELYAKGFKIAETLRGLEYFNELKSKCLFQYAISFVVDEVKCKALLDIVYFDEDNKKITVIDIKTTSGSLKDFDSSVVKFRYDIQAAFYVDGMKHKFPDYDINFKFIVQNVDDVYDPLIIDVDESFLSRGREGQGYVKGYLQLIDDLKWYREHGFENHRDIKRKMTCTNGRVHFV